VQRKKNNYAFIDNQNLYQGVQELGWNLSYKKFRVYLNDKYGVKKAYLIIGRIPGNERMYRSFESAGYHIAYKEILYKEGRLVKGNVDAELVFHAMLEFPNYEKAVIVTSDGDFSCLVKYLYQQEKLETIISPCYENCSALLKRAAREKIAFIDTLRLRLEYKK
jgi:uncharacterized LabA/DUF88 family protein